MVPADQRRSKYRVQVRTMKRTEHSGWWLRTQSALLLCGAAVLYANAELIREGRPIQCDGFLLEWIAADSRSMGTDSGPRWDAVRTIDGIAGSCTLRRIPHAAQRAA